MINNSTSNDDPNNSKQGDQSAAPPSLNAAGDMKTTDGPKDETNNRSKFRQYGQFQVRSLVAVWRLLGKVIQLIDKYDGAITAIATIAIVILTFNYVRYSKRQWKAMQGQLDQMQKQLPELQKSATAAHDSVELSRQQLIGTQAAILNIRFQILYQAGTDAQGFRSIVESSAGHVVATDVHASFDVFMKREPGLEDIGEPEHFDVDVSQYMPGPGSYAITAHDLRWLTPQVWETLQRNTKERTIAVKGQFRYNNGFQQIVVTPICQIWFARPQTANNSDAQWVDCAAYPAKFRFWNALEKEEQKKSNQ